MSRITDYKIVGETLLINTAIAEACDCRGPLDTCPYCALVRAQEALERLLESDPFAEQPAKLGERRDAQVIE